MEDRKKLNIGITGSSGFVGSATLKNFENNGDNVIALDSLVFPEGGEPPVDIPEALDWILHFGATKTIEASFKNPMDIYRCNMQSTMAALELAISKKSRFLYLSSYVYGKPQYLPVDEKHSIFVLNPYMGSKLLGEQLCTQVHQCMGLSVMILRGFTFYGPNQNDNQLISSIVKSIRNKEKIIVKDPDSIRDYLYISDFVKLVDVIVRCDYRGLEVYNVGGGKPYQTVEVAKMANELAGNPVEIHIEGKVRRNDVNECYADIEKAKRDFQWHPEISISSGLSACLSSL